MSKVEHPLVSIVILNYNGKPFLDKCLTSIFNQTFSAFEILFVDNASTDESVDYLKQQFGKESRLKIVENSVNYGPIEGNNIGMRLASCHSEYILLLNNDTELTAEWLSCMINALDKDPSIGAACSKQLLMDDHTKLQGFGSFIDQFGFNYQLGEFQIDEGQYNGRTIEIFAGGTTALLLRNSLLKHIGVLESIYEHGFDDVDFCWRVWLSGHRVVCVSSCIMYHKIAGSTRKVKLANVVFHREKNRIMTSVKNYSAKTQIRILPLIFTFDLIQSFWFVSTNNFPMFRAISKALMWDIKHFRYMWVQHLRIKYFVRKVSDEEIARHMLKFNLVELLGRIRGLSV